MPKELLKNYIMNYLNRGAAVARRVVVFDYDRTLAQIPIDWAAARQQFRGFAAKRFPSVSLPEGMRVDEMELTVLGQNQGRHGEVFEFREKIESETIGRHRPIDYVVNCIREKSVFREDTRFYIISNNLRKTVEDGVRSLGLIDRFSGIVGVDDTLFPKPNVAAASFLRNHFEVNLEEAIMLGDSDATDGEFCRALKIPFINISEYE